jgi:hypothetical protein
MNCELQHKMCELFFYATSLDVHSTFYFTQPPWSYASCTTSMTFLHTTSFELCHLCELHACCLFSSSLLHTSVDVQAMHLFIFFLVGNWRDSLNRSSNSSCKHVNWAKDAMIFTKLPQWACQVIWQVVLCSCNGATMERCVVPCEWGTSKLANNPISEGKFDGLPQRCS